MSRARRVEKRVKKGEELVGEERACALSDCHNMTVHLSPKMHLQIRDNNNSHQTRIIFY